MPMKFDRFLSLVLSVVIMLCCMSCVATAVGNSKVIVVGAHPDFGINSSSGSYSGYAYEYLYEIAKRNGYKYTYVEASPEKLFEMLEQGKIDVIPCIGNSDVEGYIGFSPDSAEGEAFSLYLSSYSLMLKFSGIYVKDDSNIDFFDVEMLKKSKIGYLVENTPKYFRNGSFICGEIQDAQYVGYTTFSQMMNDLNSGELDAVVKECTRAGENESLVYQFNTEQCYFLVGEDDKYIADQLDEQIGAIYVCNPHYAAELHDRNISMYGTQKYAYTAVEKQYIADHPVIRVAYNLQSSSTERYDNTLMRLTGVTGSMLERLEEMIGWDFEVVGCANLSECIKLLDKGEVDAICGGVNDRVGALDKYMVSSPYLKSPIAVLSKINTVVSDHAKIAVPLNSDDITYFLRQRYPNATFLPYENIYKCIDAVSDGMADIACANAYETADILKEGSYDVYVTDVCSTYHAECFAYSASGSAQLVSIMGKALAQVSYYDEIMGNFDDISSYGAETKTHWLPIKTVISIAVIIVIVLLLISVIVVATVYRRGKRAEGIDPITGGRTKKKLIDDTEKLFKKSLPENWAMVLFDINKFKFVNDRLGFEEGDKMLARVYKTVDDSMDDGEMCCRISDDNFACIIKNTTDNEIIARMRSILDEFERRNAVFVKYPVDFSAGVCRLGQCTKRAGSRIVDINVALDRCTIAKKTLKGQHCTSIAFYDGKIRDKALREKDYENIMPTALQEREFECYLQPKYGLRSRHIEGAEALIRWNSKEFGFVFPNDFIPLSEKNGFVVELDFYILEEVCRAMRRWIDSGKKPVVVSVNQSRLHLNYDDYIWRLREIVDKYDIPYEYIELELTESVFTENTEILLKVMQKLHEIGFKLSLDDFGSGYSSLNMLKDIPVDVVKIDREFFNDTVNSEKGRTVISTVVDLTKNLDMEVISEGVETKEQVEFLADIGCAMVQGYYFAKPMRIVDFETMWEKDIAARNAERQAEYDRQLARMEARERAAAAKATQTAVEGGNSVQGDNEQ